LHVLSTPPAFILSQDQTLQLKILTAIDRLSVDSVYLLFQNHLLRDVRKDSLALLSNDSYYQ
jgi:hypothetical protein